MNKDDFIYLVKCIAEKVSGLEQAQLSYGDCIVVIRNSIPSLKEEYEDDEPSDQEMMAAFGTKWHDGL